MKLADLEISVRRMLVAVDGSDSSSKAVRMAAVMARELSAELTIVHVIELEEFPTLMAEAEDGSMEEVGEMILWDAVSIAKAEKVEAKMKLLRGHPAGQIMRFSEEYGPQLIVLGSHGRSAAKKLFMGSVSDAISKKARCSVVIVR